MRKTRTILALLAVALCASAIHPTKARAQFIGYTSPQSVQQTLATLVACTGSLQNFTVANLGQTQHWAFLSNNILVTSATVTIQGIDNLGNLITTSDIGFASGPNSKASVTASGYYPKTQIQVQCFGGSFSLSYSGSSATALTVAGDYLQNQIDKTIFNNAAESASSNSISFVPPFGSSSGTLNFQYTTASIAGSSLTVSCSPRGLGTVITSQSFPLANVTTVQSFPLSNLNCATLAIAYTTGGGGAGTIALDYIFTPPGVSSATSSALNNGAALNLGAQLIEKGSRWVITNSGAAGAQAIATKAAGAGITAGVRHVADCITYSAGAIAAPAATALSVNLVDGASTIWSTTLTIPATAAPHYDVNFCGLNLIGTAATSMSITFSAGLANEFESVSLTGYDVQ